MSVIKKPDLKIFAQDAKTGEVETFPDILRGWGVTLDRTAGKPPLEWFNAIGKRVDEWLMYLTQRGVAEWDTTLSYPKTAIVQFNSVIYVSIKETKGEQPDKSQASWSTLGVFLGLGNYYTKTDVETKFQPKGNYAPAGNYQPAGDYATNTALNNGLDKKLDKTGGTVTGKVTVKRNGDAINLTPATEGNAFYIQLDEFDGKRAGYVGFGSSSGATANILTIRNDRANTQFQITDNAALINGTRLLHVGESGIGGKAEQITNPLIDLPNKQSGFYLTAASTTGAPTAEYYNYWWTSRGSTTYGTVIAVGRRGDIWTNSLSGGAWLGWVPSYTTDNTTKDVNGFIRTGSATALTADQVVQSSGTSISNVMSQKAVADITFGVNQVWRDVTNERTRGTTYTNSRNKAIMLSVAGSVTSPVITVNGSIVKKGFDGQDYGTAIIPAGATYIVSASGNILHWSELA